MSEAVKKFSKGGVTATLYLGDCREILPDLPESDAVITDPPYGDTSLEWDERVDGWNHLLKTPCLWCFGSLRYFMATEFPDWKMAQEIVWEKHNGSGLRNDRFRRVHELVVHFYKGDWMELYKSPLFTQDAGKKAAICRQLPTHFGGTDNHFKTTTGGPRMMRSVIRINSCHGYADHPTQKPIGILTPIVEYSCPPLGTIVDPFMGSGSTGIACLRTGRNFIGIEKDEAYFQIACQRIEQEANQMELLPI